MNLNLQQRVQVSQQLTLAPQLFQWLRLLQAPTQELSQLVKHELESNPALEIDENGSQETEDTQQAEDPNYEGFSDPPALETEPGKDQINEKYEFLVENGANFAGDYLAGNHAGKSTPDTAAQANNEFRYNSITARESLQEHLLKQLSFSGLSGENLEIAEFIIGSLDRNGYLATGIEELATITNKSIAEIQAVLSVIHDMHPRGVGARDLRECLLLQTPEHGEDSAVRLIIKNYLDALARNQHLGIAALLKVSPKEVMDAVKVIKTLNPKPGEKFNDNTAQYITADITVNRQNGKYAIEINDEYIPRIRISSSCERLLNKPDISPDELVYLRKKIRAANFIIQGIQQRHQTIRKVSRQIVETQREFLDSEDGKLKPLTMAQVAGLIGVHETTVSRAIANKYIKTPRGIFSMKHFFSSGYHCRDGSALTPEAVKELVSSAIENKNSKAPLTDLQLSGILAQKGICIARRTITKYRKEMGILSSKERNQTYGRTEGKKSTTRAKEQSLDEDFSGNKKTIAVAI